MTIGKTLALTAGFAGAMALGMAIGTSWMSQTAPAAVVQPVDVSPLSGIVGPTQPARPARAPGASARAASRPAAPARVATLPASQPELQQRLKEVLNRGANMSVAAEGFRSGEQFATVAYASRNTEVPFMLLKHRVLNEGLSLEQAILESKPVADAATEVTRARESAKSDIDAIAS